MRVGGIKFPIEIPTHPGLPFFILDLYEGDTDRTGDSSTGNIVRHPMSFSRLLAAPIVAIFVVGISRLATAQTFEFPFSDPAKMLDQMFGESSEADRKELEKIQVSVEEENVNWASRSCNRD